MSSFSTTKNADGRTFLVLKTQAIQFAEAMQAVANLPVEESNKVAAQFEFKRVRFTKHGNRKGLRFADGSKLFFTENGTLRHEMNQEERIANYLENECVQVQA